MSDKLTDSREAATDRCIELTEAYEVLSDGVLWATWASCSRRGPGRGQLGPRRPARARRRRGPRPCTRARGRLPLPLRRRGPRLPTHAHTHSFKRQPRGAAERHGADGERRHAPICPQRGRAHRTRPRCAVCRRCKTRGARSARASRGARDDAAESGATTRRLSLTAARVQRGCRACGGFGRVSDGGSRALRFARHGRRREGLGGRNTIWEAGSGFRTSRGRRASRGRARVAAGGRTLSARNIPQARSAIYALVYRARARCSRRSSASSGGSPLFVRRAARRARTRAPRFGDFARASAGAACPSRRAAGARARRAARRVRGRVPALALRAAAPVLTSGSRGRARDARGTIFSMTRLLRPWADGRGRDAIRRAKIIRLAALFLRRARDPGGDPRLPTVADALSDVWRALARRLGRTPRTRVALCRPARMLNRDCVAEFRLFLGCANPLFSCRPRAGRRRRRSGSCAQAQERALRDELLLDAVVVLREPITWPRAPRPARAQLAALRVEHAAAAAPTSTRGTRGTLAAVVHRALGRREPYSMSSSAPASIARSMRRRKSATIFAVERPGSNSRPTRTPATVSGMTLVDAARSPARRRNPRQSDEAASAVCGSGARRRGALAFLALARPSRAPALGAAAARASVSRAEGAVLSRRGSR